MRTLSLASFLLPLAALSAAPAQGAVVTYQYTASVFRIVVNVAGTNDYEFTDSSNLAGPTISYNDIWTGTFYYDTELTSDLSLPQWPNSQQYRGYIGSTISDTRTGLSYSSDPDAQQKASMEVMDSLPNVHYDSIAITTFGGGSNFESSYLLLQNYGGTALVGTAPPKQIGFADYLYDNASIGYSFRDDSTGVSFYADAGLTSLTLVPVPVPEPSTYAMLGLGLAALAFVARKQRRA